GGYDAGAGLREHGPRAPRNIGEQCRLREARTDKDITAVLGRDQNNVSAVAERTGRVTKVDDRQGRAVGAHQKHGAGTGGCRGQPARAQVTFRRGLERDTRARNQFEERGVRAVGYAPQGYRSDIGGKGGSNRALRQALLQYRRRVRSDCWDKAGLGQTPGWGFLPR